MDDPGKLQENLSGQFIRIARLMFRYQQRNYSTQGPMGNPHRGQGRVLKLLKMQPRISQKDLSYLLDMRPQSLGELLSKLERSGFINRTPSESDRRVMDISLTEKGMAAASHEDEPQSFNHILECLSGEEQSTLEKYLGRIIAAMEKDLEDDRGDHWFGPHGFGRPPFGRGGHPRGPWREPPFPRKDHNHT